VARIELDKLTKVYSDGTRALTGLDLGIEDGEFVVFVGPSGCGKTTALRMIAGLEDITHGTVRIGNQVVNGLPPKDRDIAMIFQNYALYPHMSAFDNMAFGLKLRKVPKAERTSRVRQTAAMLGLPEVLAKRPRTLSGGQRQRVAMGRAIVRKPRAFLMDEPLSNLDAKLRVEMRAEIARLQRDLEVTTIFVTHDQVEAMTLGDRVVVLRDGFLQQIASPQELYDRPANLFVAEFIGSPSMNLVAADLVRADGDVVARFGEHELRLDSSVLSARVGLARFEGKRVILGIRPEDIEDAAVVAGGANGDRIDAIVDIREDLGSEVLIHFGIGAPPVRGEDVAAAVGEEALEATAVQAREKGNVFVARIDRETRAAERERIELAVNTKRLHFFDPETSRGVYGGDDEAG
jgi:multiple sugar transport system ATP-binding protein